METQDSGEYRYVRGKPQRNREHITVRGLNDNYNKDLKNLFKGAAISASTRPGPLHDFYVARVEKGMRPTMARLTVARKIAAAGQFVERARREKLPHGPGRAGLRKSRRSRGRMPRHIESV